MPSSIKTEAAAIEPQGLDDCEFITLSGHHYTRVHLGANGWRREEGFLERRRRDDPVAVDRRRARPRGRVPGRQ